MRSNSQKVCCHFVLGISFMVAAAASGAPRGDRLPPPDKDPSASRYKVTICHRAPDGRFSPLTISASSVGSHLRHGDCHIDDGIACTSDVCDAARGCVHTPSNSRCNDGLFCTTEHCEPAVGCVAVSTCPPFTDGCVIRNNSCDEVNDACVDLAVDAACDDGDACTTSVCDLTQDCVDTPISCDDGNACTIDDCDGGTGCEYVDVNCDDGDACTTDSCDPTSGCVYTPVSGQCPPTCIVNGGTSSGTFPFDANNDSNTCLNTLRAACCSNVAAPGSFCSCVTGECIGEVTCN